MEIASRDASEDPEYAKSEKKMISFINKSLASHSVFHQGAYFLHSGGFIQRIDIAKQERQAVVDSIKKEQFNGNRFAEYMATTYIPESIRKEQQTKMIFEKYTELRDREGALQIQPCDLFSILAERVSAYTCSPPFSLDQI